MKQQWTLRRRLYNGGMRGLVWLCAGLTCALLIFLIGYIFYRGVPGLSWQLISGQTSYIRNTVGILPNLLNTLYIILVAMAVVLPLGVGAAIYLTEYAASGRLVRIIEFAAETLTGIPSIIFGLVGMMLFVQKLGLQAGILAGGLTLVMMILPTIIRTTQESLKTVPQSYREGALALGAGKWHMVRTVVLPGAVDGIVTGCILAIGRIVGESAALLYTAGFGIPDTGSAALPRVQKPARYVGGEYNAVKKDPAQVDTRIAFCFPDTYEIGMSNLGMRILYGVMNNMDGVWCQRVFAPWGDMEEEMRRAGMPLFALESGEPITDFDIVAFSVGYEMAFPAILNMLDLAGIPIHSAERTGLTPLVIAGGTAMYNAEPIADFIDLVSLGEGEDITVELVELHRKARREGWSKMQFLRAAAQLPGIYVPSLYEVTYHDDGTVAEITPLEGAPAVVTKRIVHDMDKSFFPTQTIVPSTEIVQDRVMLELFRGCIRGCRFCQAGYVYRPVRNRSEALCAQYAVESCDGSGYQEVTLSSLSTSDYPPLTQLCDQLEDFCQQRHVNLSLPSLRADNFSMNLMERLAKGRKSGLTFAPEAGTQRLRDVINKNVTQEDLLQSCRTAFAGGYNAVKLYFMLGLPTETDEDVLGIADLAARVMHTWRESASNKNRGVRITVSTSWFVPKPHTAFQWEPQISKEEYERRVALLREAIKTKTVTYNWHDSDTSFLEAVLARGDRRMCKVLETAWRKGSKLDAWEEYFSLDRWLEAFEECGLDPHFYANRTRSLDEKMPWDMISSGVTTAYLRRERERAFAGVTTPDCRTHCNGCGANRLVGGKCDV